MNRMNFIEPNPCLLHLNIFQKGLLSLLGILGSLTSVAPTPTHASEPARPAYESGDLLGKKVQALSKLEKTDCLGKQWSWAELSGAKGTVLVFLGTECPLAKQYTPRISELNNKYSDQGIRFVAVDPNIQDSLQEMAAHARRFQFDIPFLKDPDQSLADLVGITRTPEVCLIDHENTIRYRGRIDDQYGIGFAREKPTQRELAEAIEAVLAQRDVPTLQT
ncbi:MAG: redoxin domain-containing protein, partial [Pirellula sp.]